MGLVSEQSLYNLLVRDIELEVVPAAEHYGLGIIPWSPLQGGLLGGVIKKTETGVRRLEGRARRASPSIETRSRRTRSWPRSRHRTWDVGPRLVLHPPAVTAPIIGPRTRDQLDSALPAVELGLSPEHLHRLDDSFPVAGPHPRITPGCGSGASPNGRVGRPVPSRSSSAATAAVATLAHHCPQRRPDRPPGWRAGEGCLLPPSRPSIRGRRARRAIRWPADRSHPCGAHRGCRGRRRQCSASRPAPPRRSLRPLARRSRRLRRPGAVPPRSAGLLALSGGEERVVALGRTPGTPSGAGDEVVVDGSTRAVLPLPVRSSRCHLELHFTGLISLPTRCVPWSKPARPLQLLLVEAPANCGSPVLGLRVLWAQDEPPLQFG